MLQQISSPSQANEQYNIATDVIYKADTDTVTIL